MKNSDNSAVFITHSSDELYKFELVKSNKISGNAMQLFFSIHSATQSDNYVAEIEENADKSIKLRSVQKTSNNESVAFCEADITEAFLNTMITYIFMKTSILKYT